MMLMKDINKATYIQKQVSLHATAKTYHVNSDKQIRTFESMIFFMYQQNTN